MSLHHFLDWLNTLSPIWVHVVLAVMLFVEGIGVPGIPFEPVWLVEGVLIHQGRTTLLEALAWGTIPNWLGNIVGYYLGARGIALLPRRARESMGIEEVQGWLAKYGGWVVVFSRWFGLIRTPFILYAGAAGMPIVPYAAYSFIGALSWVAVWQVGLWLGGEAFIRAWDHYKLWVILVGVLVAALSVWLALRKRRGGGEVGREKAALERALDEVEGKGQGGS